MIYNFEDLINDDINTCKALKDSFDVDIYKSDWRHYELVDDIGGIVAYEDHGRIMVKFFESDDDGYYVANELNLWLDAFWVKAYKDALERMYDWLENHCEKNEYGYTKLLGFKMKKVMISQPMNGLTDEEITNVKLKATEELSKKHYVVVDSLFTGSEECDWADTQHNTPIAYLALSLKKMAEVDAVYFCEGWSKARGCVIEHEVAKNYGLEILGYNS